MLSRPRMSLCLVAIISLLALPSPARAGSYDVYACDAGVAGGANNSFVAVADSGMTAYPSCPAGQGMVARNVWDGGRTSALQGAWMIFDAPPGSVVAGVDFEAGWKRHDCNYTVGILASSGEGHSPMYVAKVSVAICRDFAHVAYVDRFQTVSLPNGFLRQEASGANDKRAARLGGPLAVRHSGKTANRWAGESGATSAACESWPVRGTRGA